MNTSHSSVRVQVSAMVKCLITTIHLLHDCFVCKCGHIKIEHPFIKFELGYGDSKKGLIWQQLQNIVEDSSIPTLSKIELPVTPLLIYIPDIVKQFRPKYKSNIEAPTKDKIGLEDWLEATKTSIKSGLEQSLKLVTNVKGLHIIREEALKIGNSFCY